MLKIAVVDTMFARNPFAGWERQTILVCTRMGFAPLCGASFPAGDTLPKPEQRLARCASFWRYKRC